MSGSLRIVVVQADNVMNRDTFGKSDPYCIVLDPQGKQILKTNTIDDNLSPKWPEDKASVVWPVTMNTGTFKFHFYDEDVGEDEFLGEAMIPIAEMLSTPKGNKTVALQPRTPEPDKDVEKKRGSLGTCTISWTYTPPAPVVNAAVSNAFAPLNSSSYPNQAAAVPVPVAMPMQPAVSMGAMPYGAPTPVASAASYGAPPPVMPAAIPQGSVRMAADTRLKIFVRRANKLLNRDSLGSGVSDPYVVVKDPFGKEIIHTEAVADDLNPEFPVDQATVEWPLPPSAPEGYFHFSVWDKDPVGGDEFLGEAFLTALDMIRAGRGENAVPLKPRANEPDKEVRDNASTLGTLTVNWELVSPQVPGSLGKSMSLVPSQSQQVPIQYPGNLSITIVRCANLFNRERFGTSDPYVIAFGFKQDEVHRTPVIDANLNPTFPAAKSQYMIRLENGQGQLRFHVFDKETITDNFMGEGIIDVEKVVASRGGKEVEIPLKPRNPEPDSKVAQNGSSLGCLYIKAEFEKVNPNVKREAADAAISLKMPKELKQLQGQLTLPGTLTVTVKGALGLRNKEVTGTSDPFCVVKGPAGDELLKTPKVSSSLNPEWPADKSKFVLRLNETHFGGAISFNVMDSNFFKDELMGSAALPIQYILTHEAGDTAIPLGGGGVGHVLLSYSYAPDTAAAAQPTRVAVQLPGTVVLVVSKANGLMNMEMMGTSDPFVVVLGPDGKEELRTPEASSTLNPVWPSDKSKALISVNDRRGNFTIQVWDKNPTTDDFMGEAVIAADDLLSRPPGEIMLPLKARPTDPRKMQGANLGTVTFMYDYKPGGIVTNKLGQSVKVAQPKIAGKGRMIIKVLNMKNILALDFRTSDPFVVVVIGGQRVYQSQRQDSTLNPVWTGSDATADFFLKDPNQPISLEWYDYDVGGSDDFGGKVQLLPAQLEETGEVTLPLLDENLRQDKERGTITFKWAFTKETLSASQQGTRGGAPQQLIQRPGRVSVTIESCAGLISRSTFRDTPLVSAVYKASEVFKTPPGNNRNPSWIASDSTFSQFVQNLREPIELHVSDNGKFQGMVQLIPCEMAVQGKGTLSLQPRVQEQDTDVLKQQNDLGTITFTWVFEEVKERLDCISKPGTLRLCLLSASTLISQDTFGDMEVYAEFVSNNQVLHTTKELDYSMKKGTIAWQSGDGTCEVPIDDPAKAVTIRLWDKDATGSDFLGQGLFTPMEQSRSGEAELVLRPRPNETDSNVLKAQSLGNIRVSWIFSETQEKLVTTKPVEVAPLPTDTRTLPYTPAMPTQDSIIANLNPQNPSAPQPAVGSRIRIRLSQVRGIRFDVIRDDPEVLIALNYAGLDIRTNPAVADPKDPSVFPLGNTTFTLTPAPGEVMLVRVFDAEDLWGQQPLGVAQIDWEQALVATAAAGPQGAQSVFAARIVDSRGQQRGDLLYLISSEPKTVTSGELRFEIREVNDLVGIASQAQVVCRATSGGVQQFSKPLVVLTRKLFIGAVFSFQAALDSEDIVVDIVDMTTGVVYAGAAIQVNGKKEGAMQAGLINPATRQAMGILGVQWRFQEAAKRALREYITPPDGSCMGVVEVLQVRGFGQHEIGQFVALGLDQGQNAIGRSMGVQVMSSALNFGNIFYVPVDVNQQQLSAASPQRGGGAVGLTPTVLRLLDASTQQSWGETLLSMGPNEVEGWITLNGGKQVLLRSCIVRGQALLGQQDRSLVLRVRRVEPSNSLNTNKEYVLSIEANGDRPTTQRTHNFRIQGGVQVLDQNFFFPSHLFPRTSKKYPIEVSLHESYDQNTRLSATTAFISRLRQGGELVLDLHDSTRVIVSYLWADLAGSNITEPSVKTVTIVEAVLRTNVTQRYDALFVQFSSGGAPVRTTPSADPTTRQPRFGNQAFNIVEGSVTMPLHVTLYGMINGREEIVGATDMTSEALNDGRQLIPLRARSDEVASITVETAVTLSGADGGHDSPTSRGIRRKGAAPPRGDESYPVKIQFAVGRAFGTRMEPHETLEVLKPFLARHFSVLEGDQVLSWNNKPLEWDKTIVQNRLRVGDDGVVNLVLSSNNKRNLYLLVKTPSGKSVVVGASPQSSVLQVKLALSERDDTDLEGESPDGIRLMCNYTELADDEALSFYRLQTGQTLVAIMKPHSSKSRKTKSLPDKGKNITLRVEDPYGEENIVQLSPDEPVSNLRGILSEEDNVRSDVFINGQRILHEEVSLASLGVERTSVIQFMFKKFKLGSPDGKRTGGTKCGVFDVEGIDGTVVKSEVNMDEPIGILRRLVASDSSCVICYNGRQILNENRTFREVDAVPGGHFQLRSAYGAGHSTMMDSSGALVQRQRATENLQMAVIDLQRQLEAAQSSQNAEKTLSVRVMNLERELDDVHMRYQNALDRIRELEDTIERQHQLLRRATEATGSSSILSNPSFNPQITLRGSNPLPLRPIGTPSYYDSFQQQGGGTPHFQRSYR